MSTQCAIEKLGSNEILKELSDEKNHPYCFEENENNTQVTAFEGEPTVYGKGCINFKLDNKLNTICEGDERLNNVKFYKTINNEEDNDEEEEEEEEKDGGKKLIKRKTYKRKNSNKKRRTIKKKRTIKRKRAFKKKRSNRYSKSIHGIVMKK
jgi:hypothetical protein